MPLKFILSNTFLKNIVDLRSILRVLFGLTSEVLRKKHVFSEELPKDFRRRAEENPEKNKNSRKKYNGKLFFNK